MPDSPWPDMFTLSDADREYLVGQARAAEAVKQIAASDPQAKAAEWGGAIASKHYISPHEVSKMLRDASLLGHSCLQQVASGEVKHVSWSEVQDPSHFGPTVQVTLNMLNHADALGFDLSGEQYADIYRAMHAVAPVELVSEGEVRAVKERDAARDELANAKAIIEQDTKQIAGLCAENDELKKDVALSRALIGDSVAMASEIMLLRDRVAFLESNVAHVDSTPKPDFTLVPTDDPRRMGWRGNK